MNVKQSNPQFKASVTSFSRLISVLTIVELEKYRKIAVDTLVEIEKNQKICSVFPVELGQTPHHFSSNV